MLEDFHCYILESSKLRVEIIGNLVISKQFNSDVTDDYFWYSFCFFFLFTEFHTIDVISLLVIYLYFKMLVHLSSQVDTSIKLKYLSSCPL